jgi:drug/metabolite transporter (DMT)-like permease
VLGSADAEPGTADTVRPARSIRTGIAAALVTLYIVWGSTYLAIEVALESFPPFLMGGTRFLLAGAVLYGFLRLRGVPAPSGREWVGSLGIGTLLLLGGNGGVAFAQQYVESGTAAVFVATTPIWAAFVAGLLGRWPAGLEWVGLGLGVVGVGLLHLGSGLGAQPAGLVALLVATITWASGSVLMRYVRQAPGMMATAAQLLGGGLSLMVVSLAFGERLAGTPSPRAWVGWLYLVVVGSLVGYSTFVYLLERVRPSLATSYAYVNPVVAVALGAAFAGERVTGAMLLSMGLILAGVALVAAARERGAR